MEVHQSFDLSVLNAIQNSLKSGLLLGVLCGAAELLIAKAIKLENRLHSNTE